MKRRININVKNQDKRVDTQNLEEKVDKTLIHNTCDDSKCGCVDYDKYREDFLTALTRKEDKAPKRALGPIEKPAVTNEMDTTRCEKIVTSDGDTVYAYPEDLKSMEHSVCGFNQDSISDSKESRGNLSKETIEASKEFGKAIAGKRLLEKKENDKKCVEAYKSIIDRAGDILKGLGRGKEMTPKRALAPVEAPFLDKAEDRQASRLAVSQEDHNVPKEAREARMAVNKEVSMGDNEIVPGENWEDLKKQICGSKKAAETLGILKTKDDNCHDTLEDMAEMTQKSPYHKETVTDYEYVNHPKHYNNYDMEVIDMMVKLFGAIETISFCKLNAFKYRMRAGTKPGETAEKDIQKEQWYLRKVAELESYLF